MSRASHGKLQLKSALSMSRELESLIGQNDAVSLGIALESVFRLRVSVIWAHDSLGHLYSPPVAMERGWAKAGSQHVVCS